MRWPGWVRSAAARAGEEVRGDRQSWQVAPPRPVCAQSPRVDLIPLARSEPSLCRPLRGFGLWRRGWGPKGVSERTGKKLYLTALLLWWKHLVQPLCPPYLLGLTLFFPSLPGQLFDFLFGHPYRFLFPLARLSSPSCPQVCTYQVPITGTWNCGLCPIPGCPLRTSRK